MINALLFAILDARRAHFDGLADALEYFLHLELEHNKQQGNKYDLQTRNFIGRCI